VRVQDIGMRAVRIPASSCFCVTRLARIEVAFLKPLKIGERIEIWAEMTTLERLRDD
jgi:acyl dehydratase